jgi:hypothetical protein
MTIEEVNEIFNDDKNIHNAFSMGGPFTDYQMKALTLLRNKIPYDVSRRIIQCSHHDVIYLVDVEEALPYLDRKDILILRDCNLHIDDECFAMFV